MTNTKTVHNAAMLAVWLAFALQVTRCETDVTVHRLSCIRLVDSPTTRSATPTGRTDVFRVDSSGQPLTTPAFTREQFTPAELTLLTSKSREDRAITPAKVTEPERRLIQQHPVFASLQGTLSPIWCPISALPAEGKALVVVGIAPPGQLPDGKYSANYDLMFLLDMKTSSVTHIAGTGKDRCFISCQGDTLTNKYVTFYRIANYESVIMGTEEDTKEIADEGGWEVCCYDIESKQLRVLVKSAYRYGAYPHSPLLWSPDGSKLLYSGCYEPWGLDKVNNEMPGVYVYDVSKEIHRRLTKKHNQESAICWAPDGKRFLVEVSPNPYRPQDASDFGYWIVDAVSSECVPLLLLDSKGRTASRLNDFRRSFAWSPDGRYIAFAAQFEEGQAPYDGLFVMTDDKSGRYWLVEKQRIDTTRKPRTNRFFSDLVWLEP